MTKIIIQIVNYKTKSYLKKLLPQILEDADDLDFQINVLDNNSGDDLSDLKEIFPQINFFYSQKNYGFGGGHNFLSKKQNGDILIILNPDIEIIQKNTIKSLIVHLSDQIKVVGPKLADKNLNPQKRDHGDFFKIFHILNTKLGFSKWSLLSESTNVARVSGAFFCIDKNIFDEVGGFDEKFFLYKEEEDLCFRISKLGYKIFYDSDVLVKHYGSVVAKKRKYSLQSRFLFSKKHLFPNQG